MGFAGTQSTWKGMFGSGVLWLNNLIIQVVVVGVFGLLMGRVGVNKCC